MEIAAAACFVLLARRLKIGKNFVTITSETVSGNEAIPYENTDILHPVDEFLIVNGIRPGNAASLGTKAAKLGLLCQHNAGQLAGLCRQHRRITVFSYESGLVYRKLYSATCVSGILLAKLIDRDLQLI